MRSEQGESSAILICSDGNADIYAPKTVRRENIERLEERMLTRLNCQCNSPAMDDARTTSLGSTAM